MPTLSRDDTLGIWGVPLSQTGVYGGARPELRARRSSTRRPALWQGAIHPRVVAMWETIQYQLIDRIDPDWQLVIEEPTFDDQEPLFKLADIAKTQPLTNRSGARSWASPPFGDDTRPAEPRGWLRGLRSHLPGAQRNRSRW